VEPNRDESGCELVVVDVVVDNGDVTVVVVCGFSVSAFFFISSKLSGFCGVGVTREVGVSLVLVDEEDDLTWQVSAILSVQFLQ